MGIMQFCTCNHQTPPPVARDIYLWYNNEHYNAIVTKTSSFQQSENCQNRHNAYSPKKNTMKRQI